MFPLTHEVTVTRRTGTGEDAMGDPVVTWSEPETVRVYGWGPPSPDEAIRPVESGLKRDLDVYAPDPFADNGDMVDVLGVAFAAVGHPEDFSHGPFGFTPGYRVSLARVEG